MGTTTYSFTISRRPNDSARRVIRHALMDAGAKVRRIASNLVKSTAARSVPRDAASAPILGNAAISSAPVDAPALSKTTA